jgi:hypothetical protein
MRLVSIRFVSVMLSTSCFGCHWQSQYLIEAHRIAIHCDTNFFPPPPNSVTQSVDWPSASAVMPSGMRQPSQGHRGCDFHYRDMKGCARCKDSLGPKKFWRRKALAGLWMRSARAQLDLSRSGRLACHFLAVDHPPRQAYGVSSVSGTQSVHRVTDALFVNSFCHGHDHSTPWTAQHNCHFAVCLLSPK